MVAPERLRADVSLAFGGPVQIYSATDADGLSTISAHEDMDLVRRTLLGLNEGGAGILRVYRPTPTAAFSPRDTTLESYAVAAEAMRALGFAPVERRAGGQLAVYDSSALVIDLVAPHGDPRADVMERFKLFSAAIASGLFDLGIDARVGEIAGEYCPGSYSVNGEGRLKLAGIAQRIGRCGYHLGAVIAVTASDRTKAAVTTAYRILGLPFDPITFGAVSDFAPESTIASLRQRLQDQLYHAVLSSSLPGEDWSSRHDNAKPLEALR
jgi:lipoate-protein ligase A